jgi:DNA-binding NarL/FixJ family response regulator
MEMTLGTAGPADVGVTSSLADPGIAADHDVDAVGLCQHRVVSATVLVVDDHAWFRTAVSALLGAEGFTVVGEAGDGDEALAMTGLLHPEVVLLDVQLPGIDGFEVARRLAALGSPPVVLLISSRTASDYGDQVAGSPARGFLDKGSLSGAALTRLLR